MEHAGESGIHLSASVEMEACSNQATAVSPCTKSQAENHGWFVHVQDDYEQYFTVQVGGAITAYN